MNRDSKQGSSLTRPCKKPAVTIIFSGERDGQKGAWHLDFASQAEFELYVYAHGAVLRRDQEERAKRQAEAELSDDEGVGQGRHTDQSNLSSVKIEEEESLFTEPEGSPAPAPVVMRKPRPHPMHREFKKAATLSRKIARKAKAESTRNAALQRYNFRSQPSEHLKGMNGKRAGPYQMDVLPTLHGVSTQHNLNIPLAMWSPRPTTLVELTDGSLSDSDDGAPTIPTYFAHAMAVNRFDRIARQYRIHVGLEERPPHVLKPKPILSAARTRVKHWPEPAPSTGDDPIPVSVVIAVSISPPPGPPELHLLEALDAENKSFPHWPPLLFNQVTFFLLLILSAICIVHKHSSLV